METTAQKIKVKDSRIFGLIALYDMHTEYFKRAIDGISDTASHSRLDTKANHVAWLTGSLVQERFEFAKLFGSELQQAAHELFSDHKGIQDGVTYPPLKDFQKDWERISPVLRDILVNLRAEQLDSILEWPEMPEMSMPYFDFLSFVIYREANCIGQIALWRRLLNYPALKYD